MSTDNLEQMEDEDALRHLLDQSDDFEYRRRIRARLRQLKKDATPAAVENENARSREAQQFVRVQKTPTTHVEKPRITKEPEKNGHNEFLQKSTNLRSTPRLADDAPRSTPSSKAGMQVETVALRSSPRIVEPRKTGSGSSSSGGKLEPVVLRKVTVDQKATKDDPSRSRSNAAKLSAKSAMQRFKEMDLSSEAGQRYLESGERRRSPSPNSIREQMLNWCRNRVYCYDDIQLDDFSGSWSDGMAFCALVHSFYPEAFDYDKLDRKDKAKNFQLAFDTAENLAGVVPLLDVEDMVRMSNPDWKCVFTYVNCFANRMSEIRREKKDAELKKEQEKEQPKEQEKEQEKELKEKKEEKELKEKKEEKEEKEEDEEQEEEEEADSD